MLSTAAEPSGASGINKYPAALMASPVTIAVRGLVHVLSRRIAIDAATAPAAPAAKVAPIISALRWTARVP